ncbi:transcription factor EMB1444-like [Magnolia sinica]|uniref:transcription factor EMB1444-like n=1 Tax=Magnolia sinica TaxID=86752 RepID=UPI00265A32D0|nr:transcription factor EMB1444-like [Magnolia sinica]
MTVEKRLEGVEVGHGQVPPTSLDPWSQLLILDSGAGNPSKVNRKRARPGESCRPRPRDRQLIQDRVKELREIVPNGSKCSIDALLERTIKHMIFLQSVTSHADKSKRCADSKLCGNGSHLVRTCSQDRGASWALEVGSQFKASPIIVENLNMNGQMLVEMLCEDCSLFLEIAEVIRGLGFTILKGVTESREEKTWACFVVEGRGNDGLQRMDILWSLMQLQQSKTSI